MLAVSRIPYWCLTQCSPAQRHGLSTGALSLALIGDYAVMHKRALKFVLQLRIIIHFLKQDISIQTDYICGFYATKPYIKLQVVYLTSSLPNKVNLLGCIQHLGLATVVWFGSSDNCLDCWMLPKFDPTKPLEIFSQRKTFQIFHGWTFFSQVQWHWRR